MTASTAAPAVRLGVWETLHLLAAALIALAFCLMIYQSNRDGPRYVLGGASGAIYVPNALEEGWPWLGWGLAAGEVLLLGAGLLIARRGGVRLPGGFPLRGRWLHRLLRALAWVGPAVAGFTALALAGRGPDFPMLLLLAVMSAGTCLVLLIPVYLILGLRELSSLTEEDLRAGQGQAE